MERTVAVKKLRRLLGKNLGYRVDPRAPSADEREAARAALPPAIAARDAIKEKRDARYRAILDADTEYQALRTEYKAASENVDKLSSITRHFKITVGTMNTLVMGFFHVRAQGDTWEQVIAKLERGGTT